MTTTVSDMSLGEQAALLKALPSYFAQMALLAINTGLREQSVCWLALGLGGGPPGAGYLGVCDPRLASSLSGWALAG